ncbi:hypothetical protein K2173_002230 [Erythroxylum novogranatense]|uniref:Uncharacterized protein n=1 Tax=Erythroxylum novogranatense TaxID=1862640 RepID=A0AAV8T964_9ROSI|nr:hypothetical protein K2173_002230 [Erythroxylum novogranatense]
MLHSFSISTTTNSVTTTTTPKNLKPHHLSPSPDPSHYVQFRTTYRENLRYLKSIGVIDANTHRNKLPLPDATTQLLATVNFFKSKCFADRDFAKLASRCPQLFSVDHFDPTDVEPVFQFLARDLQASQQESKGLVLYCPELLLSDVQYFLKPTLNYLKELGVSKLNVPSSLNAHLLNTREEKLRSKTRFLRSIGFSREETARFCARLPAVFGYSVESNLRPKTEFLKEEMKRSLEELKEFPQYFGFSLEKKIMPRHFHLKKRNVVVKLNRMLVWSDEKFYAKWK